MKNVFQCCLCVDWRFIICRMHRNVHQQWFGSVFWHLCRYLKIILDSGVKSFNLVVDRMPETARQHQAETLRYGSLLLGTNVLWAGCCPTRAAFKLITQQEKRLRRFCDVLHQHYYNLHRAVWGAIWLPTNYNTEEYKCAISSSFFLWATYLLNYFS